MSESKFDIYVLAVSWKPLFCCKRPEKCSKEESLGLSAHGLWPTRFDGSFPLNCKALEPKSLSGRKKHEYKKHGSCSGLTASMYFAEEDRLMESPVRGLERELFLKAKSVESQPNLRTIAVHPFATSNGSNPRVAVKASNLCQLVELSLCFERTHAGLAGKQIDCPESIMTLRHSSHCEHVVLETSTSSASRCTFIDSELRRALTATKI